MNVGSYYAYPMGLKEGTKIVKLNHGQETNVPIEYLQKDDLIKTGNGYKAIAAIGKIVVHHSGNKERTKENLYQLTKKNYPTLFEDLIVSGCESILVDSITQTQRNKIVENSSSIIFFDNKYGLHAYADEKAIPHEKAGTYTMYQIALMNIGDKNSGCYANGLLVSTASVHWLQHISKMTAL